MQVACLVSGIFFQSKITAAVSRVASDHIFCESLDDVKAATPTLVIVDLEHPESHLVLAEYGSRALAFGPHLPMELLAVAREFGAQVYTRSAFFNELDRLLHQYT